MTADGYRGFIQSSSTFDCLLTGNIENAHQLSLVKLLIVFFGPADALILVAAESAAEYKEVLL